MMQLKFFTISLIVVFTLSGCKTALTINCGYGERSACVKKIIEQCPKGHEEISYTAGDISAYRESTLVAECRD
jgi:hypothetical protein